ncbi:MAG: hypothetical protein ACREOO_12405 [bacterium]
MRITTKQPLVLVVVVISLLLLASVSVWLIFKFPDQELRALKSNLTEKEFVELKNTIRLTFVQILGGAFVLIGILLTALRLRVLEKEIQITHEGQITVRFSKAVEQLGSENPAICLGGVYALERIARDSTRDHWPIGES